MPLKGRETDVIMSRNVVSTMEQDILLDGLVPPNRTAVPDNASTWLPSKRTFTWCPSQYGRPNGTRFLKTIIPGRKATREYSRRQP